MKITQKHREAVRLNYGTLSIKKIQQITRLSKGSIIKIAKEIGVFRKTFSPEEDGMYVEVDQLELIYKTKTKRQCAVFFGVNLKTITYLIKTHRISKTNRIFLKEGLFNKPEGWNPITNSVLYDDLDGFLKQDFKQFIKTHKIIKNGTN